MAQPRRAKLRSDLIASNSTRSVFAEYLLILAVDICASVALPRACNSRRSADEIPYPCVFVATPPSLWGYLQPICIVFCVSLGFSTPRRAEVGVRGRTKVQGWKVCAGGSQDRQVPLGNRLKRGYAGSQTSGVYHRCYRDPTCGGGDANKLHVPPLSQAALLLTSIPSTMLVMCNTASNYLVNVVTISHVPRQASG